MAAITVKFVFHSGIKRRLFSNVRLSGSWNASGQFSNQWTVLPMTASPDETGCDAFSASVAFDPSQSGIVFQWGVIADIAGAPDTWVVVTEVPDENSGQRYRIFALTQDQTQDYWFVTGRRLGAQKYYPSGSTAPGIRFAVWAPHAKSVEVVFAPFNLAAGTPTGYISDDGTGVDAGAPAIPLAAKSGGLWESDIEATPALAQWSAYMNRLYMYRIVNEQGATTYKVDIFSRNQVGRGGTNPGGAHYGGSYLDLDGIVSCSVVSDPDLVTKDFSDTGVQKQSLIPADQFWASEYTSERKPPTNLADLVIYELHVGSLGFPSTSAGTFADALAFVDKLTDIGVNAVELLPVLEFDGDLQWGYGIALFFCMQSSAGGANQLKHFIRACHQRGIAVILDVVYNHFATSDGERTEWGYDADPNIAPQDNLWYWYQGYPADYAGINIDGGYLNNGSSGYTPRFSEENLRQMFTSSAAALIDDFHIDGVRVDLTDAIHQDNSLNANGASVGSANLYGIKFLRELTRTVQMMNPDVFLIAEDHTGWSAMTQSLDQGGIGFDAVWYADFYHNLIGDGNYGDNYANLLKNSCYGTTGPLHMDYFAGALLATQFNKIVYHENHDEAGNDPNTERTIVTAVNSAALFGITRSYAEARSRVCFGLSALSAGTPMFLMGEEIGAAKYFLYNTFNLNKEDLIGERTADGRFLFRFYQDLIQFVTTQPAARSTALDVICQDNDNRVIAFTRSAAVPELLVLASFNDTAFDQGYIIATDSWRLPSGGWKEVFNSDGAVYGGDNVGNGGAILPVNGGQINAVIPAHGFVVFEKAS